MEDRKSPKGSEDGIFIEGKGCKEYICNFGIALSMPIVLIVSTPFLMCYLSYSVIYECIYNKRPDYKYP